MEYEFIGDNIYTDCDNIRTCHLYIHAIPMWIIRDCSSCAKLIFEMVQSFECLEIQFFS